MSSNSATPPDTIMVSEEAADRLNGTGTSPEAPPGGNSNVPKPKRLACMICRKRKLKCNGDKPSCSTCSRLGHTCAYDEVRRKSGPKRGYVKALEERLKQVETLLQTQDTPAVNTERSKRLTINVNKSAAEPSQQAAATANFNVVDPSIGIANGRDVDRWHFNGDSPQATNVDDFNFNSNIPISVPNVDSTFTWEMIGLGLEEPLPPQETIDELHQIYFEKIHPSAPMIHKFRYLAAMNLAPSQRPPVCLRYAMWTLACSVTDRFQDLKDLFYQRARKYVESDYVKGYGEHMISVAHAQTHTLLAMYEFRWMYFPRAWMSTGAAVRLCQMIGLHRLDGAGLDVKQCLPPPRDWTEREERRRTFWMAFSEDRYASIGTGWPMTVDEKDIMTNLPASDEAFDMSRPEQTQSLADAMSPPGASKLSSFGGIVLMACLFGRNLIHLHRPDADDRDNDLNGEFWKRHRNMDNILLNTSLCLPAHLKLPAGLGSPNIIFTNMCIHTSTICLHQAAIFKADKNKLPNSVSSESKVRCITAANEIASIMRMISHMDLAVMNPFISFCLYVAARVFVQYLKSRPDDSHTGDSLRFLLSAMGALKRRNPLTESFLVQLDVDLEALGVRIPKLRTAFPRSSDSPGPRAQMSSAIRGEPFRGGDNSHCEPTDSEGGGLGIMHFRNETDFLKNPKNDQPTSGAPNSEGVGVNGSNQGANSGVHSWSVGESATAVPSRERLSAYSINPFTNRAQQMPNYGQNDMDTSSTNDLSTTSPDGGRPTPNSSSVSENRQTLAPGSAMNSSSRNSFDASPGASHQNLGMGNMSQGEAGQNVDAFFTNPNTFSMPPVSTGLTPDHRYGMPDTPGNDADFVGGGWPDMSGQGGTGMSPVGDGVLRSIMSLAPMETMDLGWESNP